MPVIAPGFLSSILTETKDACLEKELSKESPSYCVTRCPQSQNASYVVPKNESHLFLTLLLVLKTSFLPSSLFLLMK